MLLRRVSILSLLLLMIYWLKPATADAQNANPITLSEERIITNDASVDYPTKVHFRLEVDPALTIVDAVLTYDVEQISCLDVSTQVPVEVDGPVI
jgi:hypothetical protein